MAGSKEEYKAGLEPKAREVLEFMVDFYHEYGVNPGRSGFDLSIQAEEMLVKTRRRMQAFFNGKGDFNRLIFSYNATDALNTIVFGLVREGDHVISTTLEHNSVLRPLYHFQTEGGAEVEYVPFDSQGFVDPDEFRKRIKSNTRLVIVNHGSNVIGTIQPVEEIGRICKEANVYFAVDSSQTAGVQPIDVQAMNIDQLAFTGHKSLMGPTGIGKTEMALLVTKHLIETEAFSAAVWISGANGLAPAGADPTVLGASAVPRAGQPRCPGRHR